MKKGFTLVELMIVVAIIAVLTAIAIPAFNKMRDKAAIKAALSSIQGLSKAIDTYLSTEPSAWLPPDYTTMRAVFTSSADVLFDFNQLGATVYQLGYQGSLTGGHYTLIAVAKDQRRTKVWITDVNKNGETDIMTPAPTVADGMHNL